MSFISDNKNQPTDHILFVLILLHMKENDRKNAQAHLLFSLRSMILKYR